MEDAVDLFFCFLYSSLLPCVILYALKVRLHHLPLSQLRPETERLIAEGTIIYMRVNTLIMLIFSFVVLMVLYLYVHGHHCSFSF